MAMGITGQADPIQKQLQRISGVYTLVSEVICVRQ